MAGRALGKISGLYLAGVCANVRSQSIRTYMSDGRVMVFDRGGARCVRLLSLLVRGWCVVAGTADVPPTSAPRRSQTRLLADLLTMASSASERCISALRAARTSTRFLACGSRREVLPPVRLTTRIASCGSLSTPMTRCSWPSIKGSWWALSSPLGTAGGETCTGSRVGPPTAGAASLDDSLRLATKRVEHDPPLEPR